MLDIRTAETTDRPPLRSATTPVGKIIAMTRGLRGRCPNCGRDSLFRRYLKLAGACATCGEPLDHIRADDAPPYFTIVIVGHLIVPMVMLSERFLAPPTWLHLAVWPALTLALTCLLLPRVKGALVGLMWSLRLRGDENQ
jgi:uncharacterized protein (DUF983 family)